MVPLIAAGPSCVFRNDLGAGPDHGARRSDGGTLPGDLVDVAGLEGLNGAGPLAHPAVLAAAGKTGSL